MTEKNHKKDDGKVTSADDLLEKDERREFLKQLGKYSTVASATTVALLTSKRSAASLEGPPGGGGGPP